MSCGSRNPTGDHSPVAAENSNHQAVINDLREENNSLRSQIEELTRRLAQYEIGSEAGGPSRTSGDYHQESRRNNNRNDFGIAGAATAATAATGASGRGRRSIPFLHRNEKQHQGRIAYLLKLLEKRTVQVWNVDLISDLQEYCVSNSEFFKQALQAYGSNDIDLDTFIAMLQSH